MQQKSKLPTKTLLVYAIRGLVALVIVVLFFVYLKKYRIAVFTAILAGVALTYLLFFLRGYKIQFTDTVILIEYGIIFRTTRLIPYNAILCVKSFNSPLTKVLRENLIVLETINKRIILPETQKEVREKLFKIIKGENR